MYEKEPKEKRSYTELVDLIRDRGTITRDVAADALQVSRGTVQSWRNKAIRAGFDIGHNGHGFFLLESGDIAKRDIPFSQAWDKHLAHEVVALGQRASAHVPVAKEVYKLAREGMSRKEMQIAKSAIRQIMAAIDAAIVEKELTE